MSDRGNDHRSHFQFGHTAWSPEAVSCMLIFQQVKHLREVLVRQRSVQQFGLLLQAIGVTWVAKVA